MLKPTWLYWHETTSHRVPILASTLWRHLSTHKILYRTGVTMYWLEMVLGENWSHTSTIYLCELAFRKIIIFLNHILIFTKFPLQNLLKWLLDNHDFFGIKRILLTDNKSMTSVLFLYNKVNDQIPFATSMQ